VSSVLVLPAVGEIQRPFPQSGEHDYGIGPGQRERAQVIEERVNVAIDVYPLVEVREGRFSESVRIKRGTEEPGGVELRILRVQLGRQALQAEPGSSRHREPLMAGVFGVLFQPTLHHTSLCRTSSVA
jgi:hypothetical protein